MKKLALLLAFTMLFAVGCGKSDEELIKETIDANLKAFNEEKVQEYLLTLDPSSPIYDTVEADMKSIYKEMDAKGTIESFKILTLKDGVASVRIKTHIVDTEKELDVVSTRVDTLKKINGEWKIYSSVQE
ncbi:hypothetical protein [Guggenheimella bovis]